MKTIQSGRAIRAACLLRGWLVGRIVFVWVVAVTKPLAVVWMLAGVGCFCFGVSELLGPAFLILP